MNKIIPALAAFVFLTFVMPMVQSDQASARFIEIAAVEEAPRISSRRGTLKKRSLPRVHEFQSVERLLKVAASTGAFVETLEIFKEGAEQASQNFGNGMGTQFENLSGSWRLVSNHLGELIKATHAVHTAPSIEQLIAAGLNYMVATQNIQEAMNQIHPPKPSR